MKGMLRETAITLGIAVVFYLLLQLFIQSSIVENISMQPGLIEGQRLIVVKAAYWFNGPQRGDIVIIYPPIESDKQWVKRCIGVPGDTITIQNGNVYVNGIALNEPYIKAKPNYTYSSYTVPEDEYFVLGDNRNHSEDSHFGWTVSRSDIVGKAWLRIWPLNKFGSVGNYPLNDQVESGQLSTPIPSN
jgi:signal peptidase I